MGGAPVMEECVSCHEQKDVSIECTPVTSQEKQRARARGPWQVTHGKDWEKTHGMGQMDSCSTCHPGDFCAKCHEVAVPTPGVRGTHGELAIEDPESCQTCHTSTRVLRRLPRHADATPGRFLKQHRR